MSESEGGASWGWSQGKREADAAELGLPSRGSSTPGPPHSLGPLLPLLLPSSPCKALLDRDEESLS